MYKKNYKNYLSYIFLIVCITTTILSFIFKINLSNIFGEYILNEYLLNFDIKTKTGGAVSDLSTHWNYINILKKDFSNLWTLKIGANEGSKLLNFPLHHVLFSKLYFINDIKKYLISFYIISFFLPFIFYIILKDRYKELDKFIKIFLISIIFITPTFQYSAIWGNNHITALIFFSLGILFLNKFEVKNKNIFLYTSLLFFTFSCYTKQFYVFIFFYLILFFYKRLELKRFISFLVITFLLSLPGLFYLINNPILLFGLNQNVTNFQSAFLISGSIIFFYLLPFILQSFINIKGNIVTKIKLNFIFYKFLLALVVCFWFALNFNYDGNIGGGVFLKISRSYFQSNLIIFITAFLGIYYLLFYIEDNIEQIILALMLLSTFSSGFFIFQKYFEPMILIIFLSLMNKEKIKTSIKSNNYIFLIYYLSYYIMVNYIYFLGL